MPPCRHGYHCGRTQCLRSRHEGHCGRPQRRLPGTSAIAYSRNAFGAEKRPIAYARNGLGAELSHNAEALTAILASESRCGGQKFHAAFHPKGIPNEFSPKITLKKDQKFAPWNTEGVESISPALRGTSYAGSSPYAAYTPKVFHQPHATDETPHGGI